MSKNIPDAIIDLMLEQAEGDRIHVCSAEPTTKAEADTTYQLASGVISGGSFVQANGDVSGRKATLTSPSDLDIDSTGTATHIAVTNEAGSVLKSVTTCTSQGLTQGGTVTPAPYDHEIADPS